MDINYNNQHHSISAIAVTNIIKSQKSKSFNTDSTVFTSLELISINNFVDCAMVVGPSLAFFIQIQAIKTVKSSEGFNKLLVLVLLVANILRIFFWYGKHFSLVLLFQSILMIATQLYLLYICLYYSNIQIKDREIYKHESGLRYILFSPFKYKPSNLLNLNNFWNWNYFSDYFFFITLFTIAVFVVSHLIGFSNLFYVELLGTLAAGVEAVLGLPQVISNYKNKSSGALSILMVFTWMFGDTFKAYYYHSTNAPLQLFLCGVFQLAIDLVIIGQIAYYSDLESFEIFRKESNVKNFKTNMNFKDKITNKENNKYFSLSCDEDKDESDKLSSEINTTSSSKANYGDDEQSSLNSVLEVNLTKSNSIV